MNRLTYRTYTGRKETNMVSIEKYREYNPYTESIIESNSGGLIVIDRYGPDDYGAWWTETDHLYDDTFGSSTRGSLEDILYEIKNCLKGE